VSFALVNANSFVNLSSATCITDANGDCDINVSSQQTSLDAPNPIEVAVSVPTSGGLSAEIVNSPVLLDFIDNIPPLAVLINPITENETEASGLSEANATINVTDEDDNLLCITTANNLGDWSCSVADPFIALSVITVVALDDAGNESLPASTTVGALVQTSAPSFLPVTEGDLEVKGFAQVGALVEVSPTACVNDPVYADVNGQWVCELAIAAVSGDVLSATATFDNSVSEVATTTVGTRSSGALPSPEVNPSNGLAIDGTTEPNAEITVRNANDAVICAVTADNAGDWACPAGPYSPALENTEQITTIAVLGSLVSLPTFSYIDSLAPLPPVVDPINEPDTEITGTGEPGTTVNVEPAPNVVCTNTPIIVGSDGRWQCELLDPVEVPTTVEVILSDEAGNVSEPTLVEVGAPGQTPSPVVDPLQEGDEQITGSALANALIRFDSVPAIVCDVEPVYADSQGDWFCDTSALPALQVISVTAELGDIESAPVTVTVSPNDDDGDVLERPIIEAAGVNGISGVSLPNSTVLVYDENGDLVCSTVADSSEGIWSCQGPFDPQPLDGSEIAAVALLDGLISVPDTYLFDAVMPDAPVVDTLRAGATAITGSAEPGATIDVVPQLCTNNPVIADVNGDWECETTVLNAGLSISVTATDANGNVSDATLIEVLENPEPRQGDSDGDGIPDNIECTTEGSINCEDTDSDGIPDYLDADSDNDGLLDQSECPDGVSSQQSCPTNSNGDFLFQTALVVNTESDRDGDGIADLYECTTLNLEGILSCPDTDGDGVMDLFDLDSDNDQLPDAIECAQAISAAAPNPVAGADACDGDPDAYITAAIGAALDNNNNGVLDALEDYVQGVLDTKAPGDVAITAPAPEVSFNSDYDGDGVIDVLEVLNGTDPTSYSDNVADGGSVVDGHLDSDGNGVPDGLDAYLASLGVLSVSLTTDTDRDGYPDVLELINGGDPLSSDEDSDGDFVSDWVLNAVAQGKPEVGANLDPLPGVIPAIAGTDASTLCPAHSLSNSSDCDSDGLPDHWDFALVLSTGNGAAVADSEALQLIIALTTDVNGNGINDMLDSYLGLPTDLNVDFDGDGNDDGAEIINAMDPRLNSRPSLSIVPMVGEHAVSLASIYSNTVLRVHLNNHPRAMTIDWNGSDPEIVAAIVREDHREAEINTSALVSGVYTLVATVTVDGRVSQVIDLLRVGAGAAVIVDSDADGKGDNYASVLDTEDARHRVTAYQTLHTNRADGDSAFIAAIGHGPIGGVYQDDLTVKTGLGAISRLALNNDARVSLDDIESYANAGTQTSIRLDEIYVPEADEADLSEFYSFRVTNLPEAGSRVQIVLPLAEPLLEDALYQSFSVSSGWQIFAETNSGGIYSAAQQDGNCPAPSSSYIGYSEGLNEGHQCVLMDITDGGVHDADGQANGLVESLGGVMYDLTLPTISINVGINGHGLGAIDYRYLLLLVAGLLLSVSRGVSYRRALSRHVLDGRV